MSGRWKETTAGGRRVGAVYDRSRCCSCEIGGGHRPPLQFGCFALSVTCWAHHDFTDQTVLPGEIRTSDISSHKGAMGRLTCRDRSRRVPHGASPAPPQNEYFNAS